MQGVPRIELQQCKDLLKLLLETDTSQPEGHEKRIINKIRNLFSGKCSMEILEHTHERQSLILKIPGKTQQPSVAFVGHVDTVPCGDPAKWNSDPLKAVIKEEKMYGRGAADMKGGVAAMIAAAQALLTADWKPTHSILFCFTADEENGGMGAQALAQNSEFTSAQEIWVAEPTDGKIGICEKGALWLRITAQGTAAHASRPELGVNALEQLILLYEFLHQQYHCTDFHPLLGHNTVSVTKLTGGIATNILPDYAEMELDIRTLPAEEHSSIIHSMEQWILKHASSNGNPLFRWEIKNNRPALLQQEDSVMVKHVKNICQRHGYSTDVRGLHFYTDASQLIPILHCPFIIMGPGNDALAHQANEYVAVQEVVDMAEIFVEYCVHRNDYEKTEELT